MSLALECFKNKNPENDLSVLASVSRPSPSDTTWRCSGKCEGESEPGGWCAKCGEALHSCDGYLDAARPKPDEDTKDVSHCVKGEYR